MGNAACNKRNAGFYDVLFRPQYCTSSGECGRPVAAQALPPQAFSAAVKDNKYINKINYLNTIHNLLQAIFFNRFPVNLKTESRPIVHVHATLLDLRALGEHFKPQRIAVSIAMRFHAEA